VKSNILPSVTLRQKRTSATVFRRLALYENGTTE
jgi:hypothetical protein